MMNMPIYLALQKVGLSTQKILHWKFQKKYKLNSNSFVIEIACNDGYLLRNFKKAKIPCLGIEPTRSTAKIALKKGINVIEDFFNSNLAKELKKTNKKSRSNNRK